MPLSDVPLELDEAAIPGDVCRFLKEATQRIEAFQRESRVHGFVPTNPDIAYRVLRAVADARIARGKLFCEWGSGFGVVACLAAMLDFDAVGIEIEDELVDAAEKLAGDFSVPVEFVRGSFLPEGALVYADVADDGFAWLKPEEASRDDGGFEPDDFDVIFAYPWPDEEDVTTILFERYAAVGALLVTYHSSDDFRVRRKVAEQGRKRKRRVL